MMNIAALDSSFRIRSITKQKEIHQKNLYFKAACMVAESQECATGPAHAEDALNGITFG
ncbi:hypothetical protein [Microvirga lotononidis]|uniref:hypothetical protein n=1 Tax=Microvirga lotononidis TaxID=864069 RepID=UPI000AD460C1|nr:hypothetical protein [Microvirga lotononidis]WQO30701.1 hypothetical protein U0023_25055 [Microvirga lotononidis]